MSFAENTSSTTSEPLVLDLSDPNELNRLSDWEIDFRQIEPGPMNTRIVMSQGPDMSLLNIKMDRAVHQAGYSPPGMMTFGIPRVEGIRWHVNDQHRPNFIDFGSGVEYESATNGEFSGLVYSIAEQYIHAVADKTRLPLPAEIADNDTVSAMPTRSLHLLTRFSESLLFQGGGFDEFDQEGLVIGLLSFGANTNIHEDRSALATRTRAIRSAIDYVEQSDKESLLVSDVCASINIPLRTLRRAFHEKFGIGPKAYFNRVRLGQVRSELLNSERGLCIADAANEWGFWHMGQFARDYRTMFGELPSQTVDRRNPN